MPTMKIKLSHLKLPADAHKKLRLLAALLDKTMMDTLVQLIEEALEKQQQNADPKSL